MDSLKNITVDELSTKSKSKIEVNLIDNQTNNLPIDEN